MTPTQTNNKNNNNKYTLEYIKNLANNIDKINLKELRKISKELKSIGEKNLTQAQDAFLFMVENLIWEKEQPITERWFKEAKEKYKDKNEKKQETKEIEKFKNDIKEYNDINDLIDDLLIEDNEIIEEKKEEEQKEDEKDEYKNNNFENDEIIENNIIENNKSNNEIIGKKTQRKKAEDKPSAGNTKPAEGFVAKARAFQITINEIQNYEKIKNYLMGLKLLNYFISCKEIAPSTGKEHIHIYVQFNDKIKLSAKKLQNAHLEKCFGTPEENYQYIIKDGNILDEWGEIRTNGNFTIENIKKMSKNEREKLPIQLYNIIEKIQIKEGNEMTLNDFEKKVKVLYIWGESGIGKTQLAKKKIEEYMKNNNIETFNLLKYENSFWMGVNEDGKIALYDDFRDSHMKPSEFINFIDYNVHPMNVKGGYIKNKYEYIIITSVQSPYNLYKNLTERDEEPKKQWLRRMEIYHMLGELKEKKIQKKLDNF